ncbi:uncharacterized protein LOC113371007 [Ctenocephalides felis]|uniref:uncharacterized protein LOC113371007 n=1 Tax=Ctenocephalides felis TaxID=7515 RepID=UPI000E6E2F4C|nr:uncharacterized protein LOC113371007 [Ctenocephalides felis]
MRLYFKHAVLCLFVVLFIILIYRCFYNDNRKKQCLQSEAFINSLNSLVSRVHEILDHLNIIHFLCYKTLWGQIQHSNLFPWAEKAEICLKLEVNEKINDTVLMIFEKSNLHVQYSSAEGKFIISDTLKPGAILEIFIFKDSKKVNMLHRTGWKHLILPPNCEWESLDCFPAYLVEPPLSHGMLGKSMVPIPRGGIEIQKYHYKYTWWKKMERPC